MTDAFRSGLLAGYGVALPVGAIAVLLIGLTARTSWRVGAGAAMGVATADGIYAGVAVAGGAALAGLLEPIAGPLRWAAAVILVLLAGYGAATAVRRHRYRRDGADADRGLGTPGKAFVGLLGLTLLNPMTVVYFAALVLGRQAAQDWTWPAEFVFVAAAFLASASWQLLVATGGSLVGRVLAGARGRLATSLGSSALIVVLAVDLVVCG